MTLPIRILLIDDHSLFRESLGRLLERDADFQVIGHFATVGEGRAALLKGGIDVVLLDYDLGDEVGTALLPHSHLETGKTVASTAKTIIVTAGMRASAALCAVEEGGVSGIVLKHSDPRRLIEAIHRVAAGETWWDPGVLQDARPSLGNRGGNRTGPRALTVRQRQVLRSILDGRTNKEIATAMQSSESAVKATIQELFSKAGVRSRGQLVRVAIERYSAEWLADEQSHRSSS
jgi:two-component system, NarL family, nitrate/nitrite response regulator NarL